MNILGNVCMIAYSLLTGVGILWFFGNATGATYRQSSHALATQGPYLTANQVAQHVRQAGFPERLVPVMVRIARCESSFGLNSFNWAGGLRHTGLFQISDLHISACGYGGRGIGQFRQSMTNGLANTKCAYRVFVNAGYSVKPWECAR